MKNIRELFRTFVRAFQQLRDVFQDPYQRDLRKRHHRAIRLLSSVTAFAKARFADEVLVPLLDAGWHEDRSWDAHQVSEFESQSPLLYPESARAILDEFGGLNIGFSGRICIGEMQPRLRASRGILDGLVGSALYPVGETTNIFASDGLGMHVDAEGRVFVDGASGNPPPRDYRIDLIGSDFDDCLRKIFSPAPTPLLESWFYSMPEDGS